MPPLSPNVNVQASAHGIWCWGGWFVLSTNPNHSKKFKTLKFGGVGGWSCPGLNILSIYGISNIRTRFVSVCLVELNSTCHLALWKRGRTLWVRRLGICDSENQSFATRNLAFLKLQLQCFDPWLQKILTKSVGSQGAREVRENRTEAYSGQFAAARLCLISVSNSFYAICFGSNCSN